MVVRRNNYIAQSPADVENNHVWISEKRLFLMHFPEVILSKRVALGVIDLLQESFKLLWMDGFTQSGFWYSSGTGENPVISRRILKSQVDPDLNAPFATTSIQRYSRLCESSVRRPARAGAPSAPTMRSGRQERS